MVKARDQETADLQQFWTAGVYFPILSLLKKHNHRPALGKVIFTQSFETCRGRKIPPSPTCGHNGGRRVGCMEKIASIHIHDVYTHIYTLSCVK